MSNQIKLLILLLLLSVNSFGQNNQKKPNQPRIYSISCETLQDDIDKYDGKFISVNLFYHFENNHKMGLRFVPGEKYTSDGIEYRRNATCDESRYFNLQIPLEMRVPDVGSGFIKVLGKFKVDRSNGGTGQIIKVISIKRLQ